MFTLNTNLNYFFGHKQQISCSQSQLALQHHLVMIALDIFETGVASGNVKGG